MALVVEDDVLQRASVAILLEESDMDVFQCESAEAAELVLEHVGSAICFLFTDVNLAGSMTGIELARIPIPSRATRFTARDGLDTWWPTPEPPHRANLIFWMCSMQVLRKVSSSMKPAGRCV